MVDPLLYIGKYPQNHRSASWAEWRIMDTAAINRCIKTCQLGATTFSDEAEERHVNTSSTFPKANRITQSLVIDHGGPNDGEFEISQLWYTVAVGSVSSTSVPVPKSCDNVPAYWYQATKAR